MILGFAEGFPTMLKGEIAMVFLIKRHYSVSWRMQQFKNAHVNNNTCAYYLVIFVSFSFSLTFFFQFKMQPKIHYAEDDCPVAAPDGFPKDDELQFEIEMLDFFKAKVNLFK